MLEDSTLFTDPFERKNKPVYWFNKASDLRGSAGAIWASMYEPAFAPVPKRLGLGSSFSFSIACGSVYLMLCGMALEALLKAIIIEKGYKPEFTHDLPAHWKKAGLKATKNQLGLLTILSEAIYWDGRYPIPKKRKNFDQIAELEREFLFEKSGFGDFRESNGALDWKSFNKLWAKVLRANPPDKSHNRGWGG
jgi:hypothetical protein